MYAPSSPSTLLNLVLVDTVEKQLSSGEYEYNDNARQKIASIDNIPETLLYNNLIYDINRFLIHVHTYYSLCSGKTDARNS
jgi:hypothetical protein